MNYIYAPYETQPITYYKGKVKRIKHVRKNDVPQAYRKTKRKPLQTLFDEIKWQIHLMR